MPVQRSDLKCQVRKIQYHFEVRMGVLEMPEGSCCDMSGCIALFQKIDPEVGFIQTVSGRTPDTTYTKNPDGTWNSSGPGGIVGVRYADLQDRP